MRIQDQLIPKPESSKSTNPQSIGMSHNLSIQLNVFITHYGLEPLRSKPALKKALLAAYHGSVSGLIVPATIRKIELDLAAEYSIKNAAAEKKYREERKLQAEANEKQQKKRKRDEDALVAEVLGESSLNVSSAKKSKSDNVSRSSRP